MSTAADQGSPETAESLKRKADQLDAIDFQRPSSSPRLPPPLDFSLTPACPSTAPKNGQVDMGAVDVAPAAADDDSDDDIGPMPLPAADAAVAAKKRKGEPHSLRPCHCGASC